MPPFSVHFPGKSMARLHDGLHVSPAMLSELGHATNGHQRCPTQKPPKLVVASYSIGIRRAPLLPFGSIWGGHHWDHQWDATARYPVLRRTCCSLGQGIVVTCCAWLNFSKGKGPAWPLPTIRHPADFARGSSSSCPSRFEKRRVAELPRARGWDIDLQELWHGQQQISLGFSSLIQLRMGTKACCKSKKLGMCKHSCTVPAPKNRDQPSSSLPASFKALTLLVDGYSGTSCNKWEVVKSMGWPCTGWCRA